MPSDAIDLKIDVVNGKSVLELFRDVLAEKWIDVVYRGELKNLDVILRNRKYPGDGIVEGALPDHIRNVAIGGGGQIVLSYYPEYRLQKDLLKTYWGGKGYSTEQVGRSMHVSDPEGNFVAKYAYNRILIVPKRLDQFIENMYENDLHFLKLLPPKNPES